MHYIRVYGAILAGNKTSKMSKLVDSIIYEVRLLTMITMIIIGMYAFESLVEDPSDPEYYQWMIKFNFAIILSILVLVVKVLIKITNKHNARCDLPSETTSATKFKPAPDCYKTCKFVNKIPTAPKVNNVIDRSK